MSVHAKIELEYTKDKDAKCTMSANDPSLLLSLLMAGIVQVVSTQYKCTEESLPTVRKELHTLLDLALNSDITYLSLKGQTLN